MRIDKSMNKIIDLDTRLKKIDKKIYINAKTEQVFEVNYEEANSPDTDSNVFSFDIENKTINHHWRKEKIEGHWRYLDHVINVEHVQFYIQCLQVVRDFLEELEMQNYE